MNSRRPYLAFLLAAAFALALAAASRAAAEEAAVVRFSDPAQPGTLKIQVGRGDVKIVGADTAEVAVKSDSQPALGRPRKDGLRVLTSASGFSLTEKDNVVVLDALAEGMTGAPADFSITVPRSTHIVIQNSLGGDIQCRKLEGDLEITTLNGDVRIEDLAGGAVVSNMNGDITATVRELRDSKPISFTSMNGAVVVRLPAETKANVRLRTQNGSVLTDFPENALVTKTESSPRGGSRTRITVTESSVLPPEAREVLREAGRVGAEAAREMAVAVREAALAAREGIEAARQREGAEKPRTPLPPTAPKAPRPPVVPTITGGKLVTGALNGGGPEISVATMNGDVTLRQLDPK
ncbi:MAG: hypothetical protein B9S34_15850 [Opitutia bacterium Tous-C1TDCM]|nr:MAG: hypothetical protein B9S34_15850 [Opitutae bacterium Tous-C1TDCM]